jgi:hypothetical protein
VRITVHVRPNATATRVGGMHDGALVVRVQAPAERGRATEATLEALADALGVPRRVVSLVSGATGRRKVVEVALHPADGATVESRLDALRSVT